MHANNDHEIGRRSVLKGAGVTLGVLGGVASPVSGKRGNRTPLADRGADILVYASTDGVDFSYPETPAFGGHDPAGTGMFDFGTIEMASNGEVLHNDWTLFGGAVMASRPKPYVLVHKGGGFYESRAQVMTFDAVDDVAGPLGMLPPIQLLEGERWRAVATEVAQLGLDRRERPDPDAPEWGVTRIDFYHHATEEYTLSFLYLIGADDDATSDPTDGIPPEAHGAAMELMTAGPLGFGGR